MCEGEMYMLLRCFDSTKHINDTCWVALPPAVNSIIYTWIHIQVRVLDAWWRHHPAAQSHCRLGDITTPLMQWRLHQILFLWIIWNQTAKLDRTNLLVERKLCGFQAFGWTICKYWHSPTYDGTRKRSKPIESWVNNNYLIGYYGRKGFTFQSNCTQPEGWKSHSPVLYLLLRGFADFSGDLGHGMFSCTKPA
jgi:hypothetical protein